MKKSILIGLFGLASLLCWTDAQADAEETVVKDSLPPGPLVVTKLPDFAQWTVDYTYSNSPKPGQQSRLDQFKQLALTNPALAKQMQDPNFIFSLQNVRLLHVTNTKTGNIRHEERTFEQDYKGEMWASGDVMVERKPGIPGLVSTNIAGLTGADFPDFAWISKANFVGLQSLDGLKCLAFKEDRYDKDHVFLGTALAYVEEKTRLPVEFQFQVETIHYTFLPPPTVELIVPDDFLAAGKAMSSRLQNSTPHLGTP